MMQGHAAPKTARHRPAAFFFLPDWNPICWASNRRQKRRCESIVFLFRKILTKIFKKIRRNAEKRIDKQVSIL